MSARSVIPVVLMLCLASLASYAEGAAESRVRGDLQRFVQANVSDPSARVEIPRLAAFVVNADRVRGKLRTELSTRATRPYRGRVPVTVALYDDDRLLHRAIVSTRVKVTRHILVASRDLRRGEILTEADLDVSAVDDSKVARDAVTSKEHVIGMRTKRRVRRGDALRTTSIEGVPVVERGDRVTVLLETHGLKIQTAGKAQQAGAVGDWIRVRNLDSRREISGRVDHEGTVHVAF